MKWWNENKLRLSLAPALLFWVVSALCFVFGLSFQNPVGVLVGKWDISVWIAIALAISNTVIQILGNDQEFEKLGFVLYVGWIASYILGIGSNTNTLLGILHLDSEVLEWSVALSLGTMIEIMPEKLLIMFLRSMKPRKEENTKPVNVQRPFQNHGNNQSGQKYKAQHKPVFGAVNQGRPSEPVFTPFNYNQDR